LICIFLNKANIDGSARHIMHAMHAQHLVQMGNRKENSQIHRFPAYPQMNPVSSLAYFKVFNLLMCS
jgi:hypothetical protein